MTTLHRGTNSVSSESESEQVESGGPFLRHSLIILSLLVCWLLHYNEINFHIESSAL